MPSQVGRQYRCLLPASAGHGVETADVPRLEAPGASAEKTLIALEAASVLSQGAGSALAKSRGSAVPAPCVRVCWTDFGNPRDAACEIRSTRFDSYCQYQTQMS